MTGDKAVELINEWLNLAKEVGDMNLNRMEYDEERFNYAKTFFIANNLEQFDKSIAYISR